MEKDDPRTPPSMEEEEARLQWLQACSTVTSEEEEASPALNELAHQLEEAMEEEAGMSSTGQGGEEDAGSYASSLCRLPRGGGYPYGHTSC